MQCFRLPPVQRGSLQPVAGSRCTCKREALLSATEAGFERIVHPHGRGATGAQVGSGHHSAPACPQVPSGDDQAFLADSKT